jgi:RHS repeat-associated protein
MITRLVRLRSNRLTSVTAPSYTAAYTYAADGLRLRVQESNNPYPDRYFQYDGVRPVLEGTLSGDTFTTVNRYVIEGSSYHDPLISASIGGANRYYLYDGLGSTRQLVDSSQTVTDTYQYEAFGNSMGSTGSTPNPYKYVGSLGYYQTGSSLQHLGARYYMPEVGRFLQRDRLEQARSTSRYPYTGQNPVTYSDPDGRMVYIDTSGLRWWIRNSPNAFVQMLNPDNWSNANDCKAKCYYDCLKGQQLRAGITGGVGTGGALLAREGFGPVGFLAGFSAGELIALHDCAAQCGYGQALIP